MNLQDRAKEYLEYCTYRKELDAKTVKAYRIDLKQYFSFVCCDEPEKETIERFHIDVLCQWRGCGVIGVLLFSVRPSAL